MANKPNNPSLWSKAKSLAKQKFDVYPSAYANGWAAKWYKSKGGTWSKAQYGMEVPMMENGGKPEWLIKAQLQAQGYSGNALDQKMASMAHGGEPQNAGFQALPEYVQSKIMANAAYGGYIPEMAAGGWAQQAAIAIAMKKAGKKPKFMQRGGEPDGAMALGQIDAAIDKLTKLRQFIQPESDLEPWVSSKLTLMDHYTDAVSDYMAYNPEAQGEMMEPMEEESMEQMREGGIPQRYKNMGFTKVGVKKDSSRPGKKWMVLAKKGDQYKVVHGGYTGMKDYTQHGSEKRRENFWNRMGGKNSSKATDPFSPLYWHKRFGTWQEGGEIEMPDMKHGGSTFSGNAWYQKGGQKQDSTLENIVEIFDPTGISSWDDVYRSANDPNSKWHDTAIEILGALPFLGKAGKAIKAASYLGKGLEGYLYSKKGLAAAKALQLAAIAGRSTDAVQTVRQLPTAPMIPNFGMGGMPCYECGGMYQDGGQPAEQDLTRRERRELKHNHSKEELKKAKSIARKQMNMPWFQRQFENPDGWVENAIIERLDPTGLSNTDDFYREYQDQRRMGAGKGEAFGSAFIREGFSTMPVLGKGVYKGLIKDPAKLLHLATPLGNSLNPEASKFFKDAVLPAGKTWTQASPGQLATALWNDGRQIMQPASKSYFKPLLDAVGEDDQRFLPALANSIVDSYRADEERQEVPWHLVRQARKDIRDKRRKEEGGEAEMMAPDPGGVRFGKGYGKRGFMGIKPVKQWTGRNDSKLENFFELVDPTGISSWDDLAGDIRENKGKKRNWLRTASNVLSVIPRFRALYPGITFGADLPKYVQIAAPARIAGDTSKMWRYMEDTTGGAIDIMGGDYQNGGPVEGEVLDVTPEQLEELRRKGYKFEMI